MSPRPLRVRVSACICRDEDILLAEHRKDDRRYWLLPGGGVEEGETLAEALTREIIEETGFTIDVGRLMVVCEAIEPDSRHILNLVFAARITSGELRAGRDERLHDVAWHHRDVLGDMELYPAIPETIVECWAENWEGNVRVLGNVWRNAPGSENA